jgi:hypothetical protein
MGLVGCDDGDDPYSGVAFGDGTSGVGGSARASALGIKDGQPIGAAADRPWSSGSLAPPKLAADTLFWLLAPKLITDY